MSQGDRQDNGSEHAFGAVKVLRERYSNQADDIHNANEAKTRLLLIDEILSILGWPKAEFNPEQRVGHLGYTDYLLSVDRQPRLIVEAKRESYTFAPPRTHNRKNHYTLKYLRSAFGSALTEVIRQAEAYSTETRVPYAALTNGSEWLLICLRTTPGYDSVEELQGIYFGNLLLDEHFNFELFWQLLSRTNVVAGELESYFARLKVREFDYAEVPATKFGEFDWRLRNDEEQIREFYDFFFDEIIDSGRRRMLERCIVTNSRLDQYDKELQRTLRVTAPDYIESAGNYQAIRWENGNGTTGL